jgi:multisubunit Na+/H+ antiporter MnhG subunit
MNLTSATVLRVLLAMVLMALGGFAAWKMQDGFFRLHLRRKTALYISLGIAAFWLILGAVAGIFWIALGAVAIQLLTGLAAAYRGRRSEMGRQSAAQILGLRHHLKHVTKTQLAQIQRADPEYFFSMAPYAIAMGVEDRFARAFGGKKFDQCPYLVCRTNRRYTASEWMRLLKKTVERLDARQLQMEREKYAIIHFGRG